MSIWKLLGLDHARRGTTQAEREASAESLRGIIEGLERLDPERARFVAMFAYLLGRVAQADLDVSDDETRAMEREVHALGGLDEGEAVLVVQIAKSQHRLFGSTENYTVTREFSRAASIEQKQALLECLFAVSAADEDVTGAEETEIRRIARALDLTHEDYIAARSSFREHIAVLRAGDPPGS